MLTFVCKYRKTVTKNPPKVSNADPNEFALIMYIYVLTQVSHLIAVFRLSEKVCIYMVPSVTIFKNKKMNNIRNQKIVFIIFWYILFILHRRLSRYWKFILIFLQIIPVWNNSLHHYLRSFLHKTCNTYCLM